MRFYGKPDINIANSSYSSSDIDLSKEWNYLPQLKEEFRKRRRLQMVASLSDKNSYEEPQRIVSGS